MGLGTLMYLVSFSPAKKYQLLILVGAAPKVHHKSLSAADLDRHSLNCVQLPASFGYAIVLNHTISVDLFNGHKTQKTRIGVPDHLF